MAMTSGVRSRTRLGVKPRFTSLRRCLCSGSSMEIIIGSEFPWGRGLRYEENVLGSFSMAKMS